MMPLSWRDRTWADEDKAIIARDPFVLAMIRGDLQDGRLMNFLTNQSCGCPMCEVRRGIRSLGREGADLGK